MDQVQTMFGAFYDELDKIAADAVGSGVAEAASSAPVPTSIVTQTAPAAMKGTAKGPMPPASVGPTKVNTGTPVPATNPFGSPAAMPLGNTV